MKRIPIKNAIFGPKKKLACKFYNHPVSLDQEGKTMFDSRLIRINHTSWKA